jgi:hypothetical protein
MHPYVTLERSEEVPSSPFEKGGMRGIFKKAPFHCHFLGAIASPWLLSFKPRLLYLPVALEQSEGSGVGRISEADPPRFLAAEFTLSQSKGSPERQLRRAL